MKTGASTSSSVMIMITRSQLQDVTRVERLITHSAECGCLLIT